MFLVLTYAELKATKKVQKLRKWIAFFFAIEFLNFFAAIYFDMILPA